MWRLIGVFIFLLAGCTSLVPSDPEEAKKKLAGDLRLDISGVIAVHPCTFAVTPSYVRRAEFVECAFVETDKGFIIARAIKDQALFQKEEILLFDEIDGFNLRIWGLVLHNFSLLMLQA